MEKKKNYSEAFRGWVKNHPKSIFLAMVFLIAIGAAYHVNDGYISKKDINRMASIDSMENHFNRQQQKFSRGNVVSDYNNLMELMEAEKELEELLQAEELDTVRLKELDNKIRNIENNGKN
ncbi:hypothetical protein [Flagellimonas flava]|uniref:hypothetical protein n=1 Tax=Flagellimonas flava TaxID=570519 RepID=UPI003D65A686